MKPSGISFNAPLDPAEIQADFSIEGAEVSEENEDGNDDDPSEEIPGIHDVLDDMIPGVKVKVMKVVSPGKVDRDLISQVIEQIIEDEEDVESGSETEVTESEEELKGESDVDVIEMDAGGMANFDTSDDIENAMPEMSLKFVIEGRMQRMGPGSLPPNELVRVPATIEQKGRLSFLFSVKPEDGAQESSGKGSAPTEKSTSRTSRRSPDLIIADLAKALVNREKISLKV